MRSTLILFIVLSYYGSSAQTKQQASIVPLEQYYNYKTDDNLKLRDVNYFKDVNNHLDKFVGTWIGGYDNNTLTLEISILEQVEGLGIAFDELLIKYKFKMIVVMKLLIHCLFLSFINITSLAITFQIILRII